MDFKFRVGDYVCFDSRINGQHIGVVMECVRTTKNTRKYRILTLMDSDESMFMRLEHKISGINEPIFVDAVTLAGSYEV